MAPVYHLRDSQTGVVYPCEVGKLVSVGRVDPSSSPDLPCSDPHVSRVHCELEATRDGRLRVVDRSTYGTFINQIKIGKDSEAYAGPGDRIVLGHRYELRVMASDPGAKTNAFATDVQTAPHDGPAPDVAALQLIAGRYRVIREVGRGGMGVVFEAYDEERGQSCAIKVIKATDYSDALERFEREATLAETLGDYPAIVRAYDKGRLETEDGLFLVMDFVDGSSLAELAREGIDAEVGVRLVARTARAVAYAHENNVIHRDLKPENVLVTRKEFAVRLTDFGIAKVAGSEVTITGVALGTPHYMAPEQIEDSKRAGPLADVYGLGGILYCVLTGQPPFSGKRVGQVLQRVRDGDLAPPGEHVPGLDPELEAICLRALSVLPEDRYPSAGDLSRALEAWLKRHGQSTSPVKLKIPGRAKTNPPPE